MEILEFFIDIIRLVFLLFIFIIYIIFKMANLNKKTLKNIEETKNNFDDNITEIIIPDELDKKSKTPGKIEKYNVTQSQLINDFANVNKEVIGENDTNVQQYNNDEPIKECESFFDKFFKNKF